MSFFHVKKYFEALGLEKRIMEFAQSSATVELAAEAVGCQPKQIAKTMSFLVNDQTVLIVTAGDAKIDNRKYKDIFHQKAKMIPGELVEEYTGHAPGGVCPFANSKEITVFLDISLKRFETVYPAAGSGNTAIALTPDELWQYSHAQEWIDVCKDWE